MQRPIALFFLLLHCYCYWIHSVSARTGQARVARLKLGSPISCHALRGLRATKNLWSVLVLNMVLLAGLISSTYTPFRCPKLRLRPLFAHCWLSPSVTMKRPEQVGAWLQQASPAMTSLQCWNAMGTSRPTLPRRPACSSGAWTWLPGRPVQV